MQGLVYDCEIIKIPSNNVAVEGMDDGFSYCSGWEDFENMGISVICAADLKESFTWTFGLWNSNHIREFHQLSSFYRDSELPICGFNSLKFDDNLCRANGIEVQTTFDLLVEICKAAYGSPDWEDQPEGYSYSLAAIAKANGLEKTGNGANAAKLWQQGKHQEVIDYCMNDVKVTKQLILKLLDGQLIDPNTQKLLGGSNA